MRGRSRRKKRTGKMVSLQKRFLAFMLAFAMIFTNVGTDLHVSFAASGNRVDFTIGGADLVDAIRQAIEDENVVSQDSLDFTDGATEKFEALFFGDGKVYEVYPDIQGDSMEAELRVFVKLPADADDTYMVTGEEEVYFLYVNNGEDTISCSTTVTRTENGKEKEKTTKRITIKSYEDKFGDEERNIISKPAETAPAEKPSEAVNEETTENVVNPTDAEKETTAAEETAEVLFTTGTTGKSKGIELTYESVIAVSENVIGSVEMKKDSVELIPVPLSHSHGLRRYYSNILNGGSVVIIDGVIFTKKFFGAIEKYHVTAIDLVPAALAALFKLSGDKLGEYADQLDYVQLGSAPIPNHDKKHLRELLPNTRLYNFYGTTESGCSCILDFNAMPDKKNCIGKPSCHAEFVFFDEQGNAIDATEETPGFLACRGTMNMKGYYHEPQLNQEIMRDDYICTKDLAYVGEDGLIYMLGRKDDVIITGGNKVAPDEIEEIAEGFEGIADCACIPVPHPLLGAEPKLFVEMENGAAFDEQGIYEYLQGKLEAYKVPKLIEQIDKIPRTYNGKLQRKKLIEAEKEKTE